MFVKLSNNRPRDGQTDTSKGRGGSVSRCAAMLREMEWKPKLPSNCFDGSNVGKTALLS